MLLASAYEDMEKSGDLKSVEIKSVKLSDDRKGATVKFTLNLNKKSDIIISVRAVRTKW